MEKEDKEFDLSEAIGGTLDILGLKIDLSKLLSSPEKAKDSLEDLREKLREAGGQETLSNEQWHRPAVRGYVRTRGVLGDREYHIGTSAPPSRVKKSEKQAPPPDVMEPAVDVFHEAEEIMVVAEVPGVELADLELKVADNILAISTKPTARRRYRKEVCLGDKLDTNSLKASCRNGILEVHLRKAAS